ncbi:MAG: histidinol phosphate phosphatase domain-containing protein [Syntrophobacterales bacterium]|jgi:histidinol phosphatase-like PHP family hydrolase|nr:histidinol phosphate phosphatase domain-containing protein [Syntrophobacterales bacterium]
MIDLHTHSLLSDGELVPSELIRRAKVKGYRMIGISDHVDISNIEKVAGSMLKLSEKIENYEDITVLPGVEITHAPKRVIKDLITFARRLGILYVVVHGETIAEPVEEGTNREAIEGGADILAHPGIISEEDMELARKHNVFLEISGRKGHSFSNGHVAHLAKKIGARLIFNTDAHSPSDLVTEEQARKVVMGAGLSADDFYVMQENAMELAKRTLGKK